LEEKVRKVSSLKEGEDDVTVEVRVLETREPKVIETRKGPRTISEAIVGDETGRIKLTLWGKHAGTLEEGQAVRVSGAWTTSYRGQVQLNVGYKGEIQEIGDDEVAKAEEVPEEVPKAEGGYQRRQGQGYRRGGYRGGYGRSYNRE